MGRSSKRRQKQAEATRHDILVAARRLFGERGYAGTSMADIAAAAETAVQTIYDSIGPKKEVLLAIADLLDREAGVPEIVAQLRETNDPRRMIALVVRIQRGFQEHCADIVTALVGGAAVEPDVAALLAEFRARHIGGVRRVVDRIAEQDGLRPGLNPKRAVGTLAALTWLTVTELVEQHGWTLDQYEAWLTEDLCRLLLRDPE